MKTTTQSAEGAERTRRGHRDADGGALNRCFAVIASIFDFLLSPRERIAKLAPDGPDPRHIEAFMRLRNDQIDWLSQRRFAREVAAARALAAVDPARAEMLARAFKL